MDIRRGIVAPAMALGLSVAAGGCGAFMGESEPQAFEITPEGRQVAQLGYDALIGVDSTESDSLGLGPTLAPVDMPFNFTRKNEENRKAEFYQKVRERYGVDPAGRKTGALAVAGVICGIASRNDNGELPAKAVNSYQKGFENLHLDKADESPTDDASKGRSDVFFKEATAACLDALNDPITNEGTVILPTFPHASTSNQ